MDDFVDSQEDEDMNSQKMKIWYLYEDKDMPSH
jgi:hypothetical protein